MQALLCQLWVWKMPGHGLHIQAETQQAHEKVQGSPEGCSKGETTHQQCEGHVSLELQEEEEEEEAPQDEKVPWQLTTELSEGLAEGLTG